MLFCNAFTPCLLPTRLRYLARRAMLLGEESPADHFAIHHSQVRTDCVKQHEDM